MSSSPQVAAPDRAAGHADARVTTTRGHLRGSTMLLLGRVVALSITFATQVVLVRYLSKQDYGTLAYALAVVALVQSFLALGLDRTDTRFLCLYEERRDRARFLGVVVTEAAVVVSLGLVAVLGGALARDALFSDVASTDLRWLLVLLIVLAPAQGLGALAVNVFAVMAPPRAVFVRRYLLEPLVRLVAVLVVVALGESVSALATGYLVAGVVVLVVYAVSLVRLLRRSPFLTGHHGSLRLPLRELLGFSLPMLSTNVTFIVTTTFGAVLLGNVGDAEDVAAFRAVQPVAALNLMAMLTFATLFTPVVARLYAQADVDGVRRAYWQTSAWLAVLTLPVFLVSSALAGPVTTLLFGDRYSSSAPVLAVLSVGYYVNAALGLNGTVLLLAGQVRYLVLGNLLAIAFTVVAALALIPPFGAVGAGVSASAAVVVHNVVKQAGLVRRTPVGTPDRAGTRVYVAVVAAVAVVALASSVLRPALLLVLVAAVSATVLVATRRQLAIASTFPELLRFPGLRRVLVE